MTEYGNLMDVARTEGAYLWGRILRQACPTCGMVLEAEPPVPSEIGFTAAQNELDRIVSAHLSDHVAGLICCDCGRPIETAIEGEPICVSCRAGREATRDDAEVAEWIRFMKSHCDSCDAPLKGGGVCPACKAERAAVLLEEPS